MYSMQNIEPWLRRVSLRDTIYLKTLWPKCLFSFSLSSSIFPRAEDLKYSMTLSIAFHLLMAIQLWLAGLSAGDQNSANIEHVSLRT